MIATDGGGGDPIDISELGEAIVKSNGLDADAYIRKPVEPDEFVEFVQSIEDFWLTIVKHEDT